MSVLSTSVGHQASLRYSLRNYALLEVTVRYENIDAGVYSDSDRQIDNFRRCVYFIVMLSECSFGAALALIGIHIL